MGWTSIKSYELYLLQFLQIEWFIKIQRTICVSLLSFWINELVNETEKLLLALIYCYISSPNNCSPSHITWWSNIWRLKRKIAITNKRLLSILENDITMLLTVMAGWSDSMSTTLTVESLCKSTRTLAGVPCMPDRGVLRDPIELGVPKFTGELRCSIKSCAPRNNVWYYLVHSQVRLQDGLTSI